MLMCWLQDARYEAIGRQTVKADIGSDLEADAVMCFYFREATAAAAFLQPKPAQGGKNTQKSAPLQLAVKDYYRE